MRPKKSWSLHTTFMVAQGVEGHGDSIFARSAEVACLTGVRRDSAARRSKIHLTWEVLLIDPWPEESRDF